MSLQIKVTKTKHSRLSEMDFSNIPFGKIFTDHMFVVDFIDGKWQNAEIKPLDYIPTHPGNLAWHYGQSIFEGMKATISKEGNPLLFRTDKHIERLNASAWRMCMPELPKEIFMEGLRKLVYMERGWIPKQEGSALYIRPLMYATDESIGVRASDSYRFIIMCLPVGPYYSQPVKLKAEEHFVRAVKGGVGEAKTSGNYAASLRPSTMARAEGYDQMMWLDAVEFKYIQEVGTMNIFFVIGDEVITPATDGAILKGITRDCIITLLRDKGYKVVERQFSIDEMVEAFDKGSLVEVFGAGTAAVIAPVCKIKYKDRIFEFDTTKYEVSKLSKATIEGIRAEKIEDKFGWIEPVYEEVLA